MSRPIILVGCWPRRMTADLAATYCGEPTANAFLKRVGSEYPKPRVNDGRRKLWLKDDLDQAILPPELVRIADVAEDCDHDDVLILLCSTKKTRLWSGRFGLDCAETTSQAGMHDSVLAACGS